MKAVVQRVKRADVKIGGVKKAEIGSGFLVLLGVGKEDGKEEAMALAEKIANLRVLDDKEGRMNLSPLAKGVEILVVSQFTLFADASKGRRPSFNKAAGAKKAEKLYEMFLDELRKTGLTVKEGEFGALMDVSLVNSGPVTIVLDTNEF